MIGISTIRIGARGSNLSLRQVTLVADMLKSAHPELLVEVCEITTIGDRLMDTPLPMIGGKGVFTGEIEAALFDGRIDLAVHSLKDLPTGELTDVVIGAIPVRGSPVDVLIGRTAARLADLPAGARIGTSSPRRGSQLKRFRTDLQPTSIRGNVETRLRKGSDPALGYDAVVLAAAGLDRLGIAGQITETLPIHIMLPAPGQGALAVQCRDEARIRRLLASINHPPTDLAVTAERAFLQGLGGGCSAPIAALGRFSGGSLNLIGRVLTADGSRSIDVSTSEPCADRNAARDIGLALAQLAIERGAGAMVEAGAIS